jgi:type II secretory pathway component PulC
MSAKDCVATAKQFFVRPHHTPKHSMPFSLNKTAVSHALTTSLILITICASSYWVLQVLQTPDLPNKQMNTQNASLLKNENIHSAYALFGTKPLSTQNIFLRGLVITSTLPNGQLDGFAVFEVDGKPSKAIAIGESLGNNLVLESIHAESATLIYQGQKLEFSISKTKSTSHLQNPKS